MKNWQANTNLLYYWIISGYLELDEVTDFPVPIQLGTVRIENQLFSLLFQKKTFFQASFSILSYINAFKTFKKNHAK
jgi:hypothetical protein